MIDNPFNPLNEPAMWLAQKTIGASVEQLEQAGIQPSATALALMNHFMATIRKIDLNKDTPGTAELTAGLSEIAVRAIAADGDGAIGGIMNLIDLLESPEKLP